MEEIKTMGKNSDILEDDKEVLQVKYSVEDDIMRSIDNFPKYINTMMVCVDSFDDGIAKGRLYFYFKEDAISFLSLDQLLFAMEDVMDQVGTPQAWMKKRSFSKGKNDSGKGEPIQNRNPFYDFQAICPQKGHIASFYVRIYSRMNSSVQGGVKFEGNSENVAFRSELEFLHLIREGLSLATK